MNTARDRAGRAGRFVQRFGEIPALDQIRKSFQEFADVDGSAMQIEKALGEDSDGDNAAGQNRPHEQSALLDVVNHGGYLLSSFSEQEQATVDLILFAISASPLSSPSGRGLREEPAEFDSQRSKLFRERMTRFGARRR